MLPNELTATEAARLIARRELSCEELTRACLARIRERDGQVRAWAHLDVDAVLAAAQRIDRNGSTGNLRGLPIGVKDTIATKDMPTAYNSPLFANQMVGRDAACVGIARHSGALIFGKAETVEFAVARRARTRNPHNPAHTPGGSSSGSAAAVADFQVPLALGTQTGGSVIRPAAFTGIYALKPTFGLVSVEGVKPVAPSIDTLGWFARGIEDLGLVADSFELPYDEAPRPVNVKSLRIGLCHSPMWESGEENMRDAFAAAARRIEAAGAEVVEFTLPSAFSRLTEVCHRIVDWEVRAAFLEEALAFGADLPQTIHKRMERAAAFSPRSVAADYALVSWARHEFDRCFSDAGLDALLTPAAPGEAPAGLDSTGNSIFNAMWTLLHLPCIAMPAGVGANELPLGVQLVAPCFCDRALLHVAGLLAPAIDTVMCSKTVQPGFAAVTHH